MLDAAPFTLDPRFRVTILLGYRLGEPLPEAVEMAKAAASDFQRSGLAVEIRVDLASMHTLLREARRGTDLLILYGHGSESGRISFSDHSYDFAELSAVPLLERFWKSLRGCFVFACFGDRFAEALPCPWVAFCHEVLTHAPKGFLHALIPALQNYDLVNAIEHSRLTTQLEMQSGNAQQLRLSSAAWASVRIPHAEARVTHSCAALSGRYHFDFGRVTFDDRNYPDHEPFVGRRRELERLLELPSPHDDRPLQRVVWLHGPAGLGKSALIRELATLARDVVFRDADDGVHVLHLYCSHFTRAWQLEATLCEKAARVYDMTPAPQTFEELSERLEPYGGTHLWLLDDLTYLTTQPGAALEADRVVRRMLAQLRSRAIRAQLVVSARQRSTGGLENLEVGQLSEPEAAELAGRVYAQSGARCDPAEVASLYRAMSGSTAAFKRALCQAAEVGQTPGCYAGLLREPDSLENQEQIESARAVLQRDLEALALLETKHGFSYRSFLERLFPLVERTGRFSVAELEAWFGDAFKSRSALPRRVAYQNGLTHLVRIGFLTTAGDPTVHTFSLAPNQRWNFRALAHPTQRLPGGIPRRLTGRPASPKQKKRPCP